MTTFAADRPSIQTFVGRSRQLTEIAKLQLAGRSWALRGGRRLGKTMTLRFVETHAPADVVTVYVDKQGLPQLKGSDAFFSLISGRTALLARDTRDLGEGLDGLTEVVSRIAANGLNWCLLVDEIDSLARESWGPTALENLRYLVSNSSVADTASVGIAGGVDIEERLQAVGSSVMNVCRLLDLEPFTHADVRNLVALRDSWDVDRISTQMIRLTGGHPYLAQRLLEEHETDDAWDGHSESVQIQRDADRLVRTNIRHLPTSLQEELVAAAWGDALILTDKGELAVASGLARMKEDSFVLAGALITHALATETEVHIAAGTELETELLPNKPFSNFRVFRRILESAGTAVRWYDNHGGVELLDALADADLAVADVWVLSGAENVRSRSFQRRYRDLCQQLGTRQVALSWRIADSDDVHQIHDRYLLADSACYDVPPLTAVRANKRGSVGVGGLSATEFDRLFRRGSDVAKYSGAQT